MIFDVTSDPLAQEAESIKYLSHQIVFLSDGSFAVFTNFKLIYIGPDPLSVDLSPQKQARPEPPLRAKLDLKALGLLK